MTKVVVLIVAAVLLVGALAQIAGWLLVAAAGYAAYRYGRALWRRHTARQAQLAHRRAEMVARAELQHRWYLDGDPRGIHGRYPPAVLAAR